MHSTECERSASRDGCTGRGDGCIGGTGCHTCEYEVSLKRRTRCSRLIANRDDRCRSDASGHRAESADHASDDTGHRTGHDGRRDDREERNAHSGTD